SLTRDGAVETFPVTRFEDAMARARELGASAQTEQRIRECFWVQVHRPDLVTYDAGRSSLVAAVRLLINNHQASIGTRPREQVLAWLDLRDRYRAWKNEDNSSLAELAAVARPAAEYLLQDTFMN